MSNSSDARDALRNARQSGPSGPDGLGWTPMSAAEFAAELARSHSPYVVNQLLGHGGMGAVYLAEDRHNSRRVAIKMLRPDALDDEAYLRRFDREIESLRKLDHPNIVRIFDAGKTLDGYRFFVMELLEGRTLASKLEEPARMSFDRVVRIMADICAGAQQVHDQKIVHRDLKAANVFLVEHDGRAVLLDFGIARDVTVTPSTVSVPGTPGHIAPELREGKTATPASDVFSLGVIFLHLVAGNIPDGAYVLPSHYGLDSRLDAVATKALSRNLEDRYRSAAEFAAEIRKAASPAPSPVKPVEPVPPPPRQSNLSPSTTQTKAKEKSTDGDSSVSTAPPPKDIVFPSETRLKLHRDYLANWRPSKPPKTWQSTPISEDQDWKVIDQWNAFPKLPSFDEVQGKREFRRKLKKTAGGLGVGLALVLVVTSAGRGQVDWGEAFGGFLLGGFILASLGYVGAGLLFDWWARLTTKGWNWNSEDSFVLNRHYRV
ncbi:MAG: serine/threonine protein kinase [Deltaproteobacteria bacterium]|nr:serine/threonine protein kinase [Deltaproteobacteria bacterium]